MDTMPVWGAVTIVLTTFISLGAGVVLVLLIVRAITNRQKLRHEALMSMIDKGVYDPRVFSPKREGAALLGWGLAFAGIGLAIIIGLLILGTPEGTIGGLIPLFLGAALIATYAIIKRTKGQAMQNGEPMVFPKAVSGSEVSSTRMTRSDDVT